MPYPKAPLVMRHPPRQYKEPDDWTPILMSISARLGVNYHDMTLQQTLAANHMLADEDKATEAQVAASSGDLTKLAELAAAEHKEPSPEQQAKLLKMAQDLARERVK